MEPPPPDISAQQLNNPAASILPPEDPAGPQRKRPRSGSSATAPITSIFDYDPTNPIFSAPGATLLGELANLVNMFAEDEPTSLDSTFWLNLCESVASAVARSIERMDFGDDAGSTRVVREGMKIFANLARHFDAPEDADMDQDKEPDRLLAPNYLYPTNDTVLTLLREIQANNKSMNDRMFRLENRIAHASKQQEDRRTKTNATSSAPANPAPPPSPSGTTRPTYAAVTGSDHNTQSALPESNSTPNQGRKSNPPTTTQRPQPIRYIVRYLGHPPSQEQRLLPKIISSRINSKLSLIPSAKGLSILGSHWNASGNCVLTFPPQTSIKLIEDHFPAIKNAMGLNDNQVISRDTPWSKVTLRAVYARDTPSSSVYSNEDLLNALMTNPIMSKIRITQAPRWVRRPEDIDGFKSSISFAFEDPDGQLIKLLLKTQLFMFGSPVRAKRWEDKPRLRQCSRCWKLGHFEATCRGPARCRRCSEKHAESTHREHCKDCTNTEASIPCNHPPKCVNCREAHAADAPECPERRKYSIPLTARYPPADSADNDRMQG
jgi:hypothetical protein